MRKGLVLCALLTGFATIPTVYASANSTSSPSTTTTASLSNSAEMQGIDDIAIHYLLDDSYTVLATSSQGTVTNPSWYEPALKALFSQEAKATININYSIPNNPNQEPTTTDNIEILNDKGQPLLTGTIQGDDFGNSAQGFTMWSGSFSGTFMHKGISYATVVSFKDTANSYTDFTKMPTFTPKENIPIGTALNPSSPKKSAHKHSKASSKTKTVSKKASSGIIETHSTRYVGGYLAESIAGARAYIANETGKPNEGLIWLRRELKLMRKHPKVAAITRKYSPNSMTETVSFVDTRGNRVTGTVTGTRTLKKVSYIEKLRFQIHVGKNKHTLNVDIAAYGPKKTTFAKF